jgi:hypothetical protein
LAGELRVVVSLELVYFGWEIGMWTLDVGHLHIENCSLKVWTGMLLGSYERVYVEFCMDIRPFQACGGMGTVYLWSKLSLVAWIYGLDVTRE